MNEPILAVSHLTKQFKKFRAVNDISFRVNEGEIVGLLGRNGAGKTTTISMLLGLLTPTSGTIHVFGQELEANRSRILGRVNFSSAYVYFPERLTVRENLAVFSHLYSVPNYKVRIAEVMEIFDVTRLANKQYLYLSAGQKTRVHLAKAILNKPQILFLDEPTAALDPDVADLVRKLLVAMQQKERLTVLVTSHNMAEVEEVADRVLFIDQGKIIAEDTPEGLAARITHVTLNLMITDGMKRTLEYCRKHHFPAQQEGRYLTVTLREEDLVYFLAFLPERGIAYREISIDRPTLEDFFLQTTRRGRHA